VVIVVAAGCGSSTSTNSTTATSSPATTEAAVASSVATTQASSPGTTGTSAEAPTSDSPTSASSKSTGPGAACPQAAVEVNRALALIGPLFSDVFIIRANESCTVNLSTDFIAGDSGVAAKALELCQKSADAAYANGAESINVADVNHTPLATGVKGQACKN
jgi:hypothetical protein